MILEEGNDIHRPVVQVQQPSVKQQTRVFCLITLTVSTIFSSQILSVRSVHEKERYRIVITDGVTTSYAMLATQMNDAVNDGLIKAFTVICVEEYVTSNMSEQS
jgi:Replication factor-A protein 1, N-terminal domain